MKKIILFSLILIAIFQPVCFSYYDMSTPVEGNSIANNSLQFSVVKSIYKNLSIKIPTCSDFTIKDTQVIHFPYDVKKKKGKIVKGYWKELWTVDVCGKYKQVPVTFYINKKKTTFDIDSYFLPD